MRRLSITVGLLIAGMLFMVAPHGAIGEAARPASRERVAQFVAALGADDYKLREDATRALISIGLPAAEQLRAARETTADPEVRRRLDYILEGIIPPEHAIIVIVTEAGSALAPGDLITHIDGVPVRDAINFRQRLRDAGETRELRVLRADGPAEIQAIPAREIRTWSEFNAAYGPEVVEVVRDYAAGYAERAHQRLTTIDDKIGPAELSFAFRALVQNAAGHRSEALDWLLTKPELALPPRGLRVNEWAEPAPLDYVAPHESPHEVELTLWQAAETAEMYGDPDPRVQRIWIPARRSIEALTRSAELWWTRYRDPLRRPQMSPRDRAGSNVPGNMLAVISWMCSELELASECLRLIEPRSVFLRMAGPRALDMWVRVRTDAWLPFLQGDTVGAIDRFYSNASDILGALQTRWGERAIRDPEVAARIAFFLYQQPEDERRSAMLETMRGTGRSQVETYAWWMLFGLHPENEPVIRSDLSELLTVADDETAGQLGRWAAVLEYVQREPDGPRLTTALNAAARSTAVLPDAISIDALRVLAALARNDLDAAASLLSAVRPAEQWRLRDTVEYRRQFDKQFERRPILARPLLAIKLQEAGNEWLVLTRDRRLLSWNESDDQIEMINHPTETWLPGPLNWPWISRDASNGRSWVYDRRRLFEVTAGSGDAGVRLNIPAEQIALVDALVTPRFDALAGMANAVSIEPTEETGAFRRADIAAHHEFVADPALPDLTWVHRVAGTVGLYHLALRGGPHALVERYRPDTWTSADFAAGLDIATAPTFFARTAPEDTDTVFLFSSHGLIRLDRTNGDVSRIALPGPEAYPSVIPEDLPYPRRDPRYLYAARLPADGSDVFRIELATLKATALDLKSIALPPGWFAIQSRAALRRTIDAALESQNLPQLDKLITDADETVQRWAARRDGA